MLNVAFTIESFAPSHATAVAELEKQCFSEPWSAEGILESYKNGTVFIVAVAEGRVIGYGGVQMVADEGYVTNIAVAPTHRRLGVGAALTQALILAARGANLAFISLEVRESNLSAQALYQKNGFALQGRRKGFYRSPTEDALIFTKYLKD